MIKAAIFDMDGVLIKSEPLWGRVYQEVFEELGLDMTPAIHHTMLGQRTNENLERLCLEQKWEGVTPAEVEKLIHNRVIKLIKKEGTVMRGVHHALSVCKAAGLPVAIASSSNVVVIDAVVNALQIREHFDHIYSAEYEEYGKPHPAVFLKVAKHFRVAPTDCVVFEDSPAGVLAAKAARMRCIALPGRYHKNDRFIHTADYVLDSLEDFTADMLTVA